MEHCGQQGVSSSSSKLAGGANTNHQLPEEKHSGLKATTINHHQRRDKMFFEKQVDTRSRQAMVKFLTGHFRYAIDRSWSRTTYANRVKIPYLGLTREQEMRASEVLSTGYWSELQSTIDDFTFEMDGNYTIGVNGRSGGYLVLLQGEYYDPGYKSRCRACGRLNFKSVIGDAEECRACHKHERVNLSEPMQRHRVLNMDLDQDLEFDDWSMSALRERVELVREFDRACDDIRNDFIDILDNFAVVEETVMVPTTVRRLACVGAGC
jgi:hypothetical protein